MRRGSGGSTLLETTLATFILAFGALTALGLLQESVRWGGQVERHALARSIALRLLAETRQQLWRRSGGPATFYDIESYPGIQWDSDYSSLNPDVIEGGGRGYRSYTGVDPFFPEFGYKVWVYEALLPLPSAELDGLFPGDPRQVAVKKVRALVAWGAGSGSASLAVALAGGSGVSSLTMVDLVRAPPGRAWGSPALVISGSPPPLLGRDETVTFTVEAFDADGLQIKDMIFRWDILPTTGRGTLRQTRQGSSATFQNVVLLDDSTTTYTGGECRLSVRAVLEGVERAAHTAVVRLQGP